MADYTHTFEIQVDGITVEGEITFDHGQAASFKTSSGEEMKLCQHAQFQRLLETLANFSTGCGEIQKIEINKK